MRKKIVAGNWKMNMNLQDGIALAKELNDTLTAQKPNCGVIICTPFIHLASIAQFLNQDIIGLGAENCADQEKGAYTGEISASMLVDAGVKYVILGHSERREYFKEDDELLNKKVKKAFINAHILEYDEESPKETMEEGCLSLPGIHESVTRPTRIHVKYMDTDFNEHDEWVEGYLARVMQHEFDHLEGKMFIDRISPLRKQLIRNKLKSILDGRYRCSYRTKAMRR